MESRTKRNNFGVLSKQYDRARRGYPEKVFQCLKKLAPGKKLKVLDIGCGTGISTRQLNEHKLSVIGVDKYPKMVEVAKKRKDKIPYTVAPIDRLPFKDGEFDIVTAFTAFHWFTGKKSVGEIKRVLKKWWTIFHGDKISISERLIKKSKACRKRILKKYVGEAFDSAKNYQPAVVLRKNGFIKIKEVSFHFKEKYILKDAMLLMQSFSSWNLVPSNMKPKLHEELEDLYRKNLVRGLVIKNREAEIVAGQLKK